VSLFVTFEGIEGSGKSTHVRLFAEAARARGRAVLETHEPGDTVVGRALRQVLLDPANGTLTPLSELLLYCADRSQHVSECSRPALADGTMVLCARYSDTTLANQGYGRGLDQPHVRQLDAHARDGLRPSLTIHFDCPAAEGLARARRRSGTADRLEAAPLAFHERVRTGFLRLADATPDRYAVIDSRADLEAVRAQVAAAVERRWEAT
jgi:dTMP kinase